MAPLAHVPAAPCDRRCNGRGARRSPRPPAHGITPRPVSAATSLLDSELGQAIRARAGAVVRVARAERRDQAATYVAARTSPAAEGVEIPERLPCPPGPLAAQ